MSKFVFKLESFLKIKEKLEDSAKTEYGKAILKLEEEKDILNKLENQKLGAILKFKESLNYTINPFNIKNMNEFIKIIDIKILNQMENVQKAFEFSEEKRQNLIDAMKERKIFETLKEKEKEAYIKEILQKEQKIIDEIVSYKYNNE